MSARTRRVLAAVVLATDLLAAGVGPTAAAPATPDSAAHGLHRSTVGGPLLASRGLVVQPLPGAPALPAPRQLPASSWLVANLTTGQILAAKDPHARYLPASTLKMLTAVTLLPKLRATRNVTTTFHDASVDGTRVGLVPGHHYTVAMLFTAMLMVSANDAADALAQAAGGTRLTLDWMNAEARHLQANDTVAKTPSGLDAAGESTSAYDLALIAQAGLAIPAFRRYVSRVKARMPAPHHKHYQIYTHNELLTTYRGDIGIKNGYTVAAEGTDVQAATRHGQTIVVTLMHAYPNFWPMAKSLLNWGFAATGKVDPVGTVVQPLPPPTAATTHVAVATAPAAVSSTSGHGRRMSTIELGALVLTVVALVGTVAGETRRRRRRRYRSRWTLPRY
jgi:D-alanyl-D-alanine carboxypeptidase (penicillin-binding protein 5/6)